MSFPPEYPPVEGWEQARPCNGRRAALAQDEEAALALCAECPVRLSCESATFAAELEAAPATIRGVRAGMTAEYRFGWMMHRKTAFIAARERVARWALNDSVWGVDNWPFRAVDNPAFAGLEDRKTA